MMRHIFKYILIFSALLLTAVSLPSCRDELDFPGSDIPEGETRVQLELRFTPLVVQQLAPVHGTRSETENIQYDGAEAPKGDAMDQIKSLYILFYDATTNTLIENIDGLTPMKVDLNKYKPVLEPRNPNLAGTDASGNKPSTEQEDTYCVKIPELVIPNGRYKIFAVANIDDFLTEYKGQYGTVGDLRQIKLNWTSNSIGQNCQMFGSFTNGKNDTRAGNFETDNLVEIKPGVTLIHSWIRRAVSKLTIDFDGTQLNENVKVYIFDAQVKDIASGCYLGQYSCVGSENVMIDPDNDPTGYAKAGGFTNVASAHRIQYGPGKYDPKTVSETHTKWPLLMRNGRLQNYNIYKKEGDKTDTTEMSLHDEKAYCLPFYENMQGKGKLDKRPSASGDILPDYPDAGETNAGGGWKYPEAKDGVPNGTYVEVRGYYEAATDNYVSTGPIVYRFMLGKDTKKDFNLERNHHLKLTLCVKGFGNEADWHIDYKENLGLNVPNPLYISYLYNHTMILPFSINTGGRKIEYIRAEIVKCNWAPTFEGMPDINYNSAADKNGEDPENGFLSLFGIHDRVLYSTSNLTNLTAYWNQEITADESQSIQGKPSDVKMSRKLRYYDPREGTHAVSWDDGGNGSYTVQYNRNQTLVTIPLFTRAKQLISSTGFTGNNPYVGYPRSATIKITVKLDGIADAYEQSTEIIQVRRLVNPKGIYRDWDSDTHFDVTLMELPGEYSTSFRPLQTIGPWSAEVIATDNGASDEPFIDLNGQQRIEGEGFKDVKFRVNFKSKCSSALESRFAVIRVWYHNNTCAHLIFVRQGDAPVQMYKPTDVIHYEKVSGQKVTRTPESCPYWRTFNLVTKSREADNILDEGSMFRFGNFNQPLDASGANYTWKKKYWVNVSAPDFKDENRPMEFKIAGKMDQDKVHWSNITNMSRTDATFRSTLTIRTKTGSGENDYIDESCHLPSIINLEDLRDMTEQGYGILYGDKATTVQTDLNMAYCYQRDEEGKANSAYGMRGCFVYVKDTSHEFYGRNLFFPIGASGYGHRKTAFSTWAGTELDAVLRYGVRVGENSNVNIPLFFDLYKRPGALYWVHTVSSSVTENTGFKDALAWDINYFTFDFNPIGYTNVFNGSKSDAMFIRLLQDSPRTSAGKASRRKKASRSAGKRR